MSKKLYYKNPYIQTFSARVIKQEQDYVVLSETAFYPTGGGQPHDTGTLNGIPVVDVEIIDGEIRHFLAEPLQVNTEKVEGSIDWDRRFDHMQQHAGQHILSAAFESLFGFQTISFHLGKESATIDLDTSIVTEEQLNEAEKLANQIILENWPIDTKWVTLEELKQYKLRKATTLTEDIRLVIIPDFDYNACGGTHPEKTGQVRLVKILRTEKQKSHIRVEFICGERVLAHLHRKQQVLLNLINTLNAPEEKLPDAAKTLLDNGKAFEKQINELKDTLIHHEAKELLSKAETSIITATFHNRTIQALQKLARTVVTSSPETTCLFVSENEHKLQIVAAKGNLVEQNMKELVANVLPYLNGKGGGNEKMAQGGGDNIISSEQLIEKALFYIR
ncbi:alanyl-tRNA editing protein [Psychrobacillus lasiicapitis]|uniref:Alanine--tRNA ligase n=1 Tax=Psychrobacillus lasiicapitis TaxID=1636719 RepID=A0A544TCM0_9BACI|nr:DHHA1 domain-containing protein [Psychrobacillus lasiicapitis]TQR15151.1 alanyl-tRNA editing protein [Psychrobacillus lasiicapitis]GGA44927.1 alanyl-tRNA editing protein [Psychrobacillus lasiicapitis]